MGRSADAYDPDGMYAEKEHIAALEAEVVVGWFHRAGG